MFLRQAELRQIFIIRMRKEQAMLASLDVNERKQLAHLLRKLLGALERDAAEP